MKENVITPMPHVVDIKEHLKKRLLEIPVNHQGLRENYRLAKNIGRNIQDLELFLRDLCDKGILEEKIQYCCPKCRNTLVLNKYLLAEYLDDDGYLECQECYGPILPKKDKTGYVYYDIIDKAALLVW